MGGLLWMLGAVLLLGSTNGNQAYDKEAIINKATKEANTKYGQNKEIGFYSILSTDGSKQMVHVLLSSTSCKKETKNVYKKECRPWVSCVACGDKMDCELAKFNEKIKEHLDNCKSPGSAHFPGGAHLMYNKGGIDQEYGCLGCI